MTSENTAPNDDSIFDLDAFLMLGIMLCAGSRNEKCKVYYRLIQESMQELVDSYDKELRATVANALRFSTLVLPRV